MKKDLVGRTFLLILHGAEGNELVFRESHCS